MMKTLLDAEGVSYEIGDEEDEVTMSKKEMIKLRNELLGSDDLEASESPMMEEPMPTEEMPEEPSEAPRGLMSRK